MVQNLANQQKRPHTNKWITGLLLICVATLLTGCSAKETSGVNVRYAMKAPGISCYFFSDDFFDMYETAPVIMVVQPTTPLNQRESHISEGSMRTYIFATCRVTDVIANRSGEVVNVGEQVNIAERMYFESSERQWDIYETGDINPNALYSLLDTLMIDDFYFFPLSEGTRYLVFCDVNHFGGEDGPVAFWPKLFGVMDLSSIKVTDSEMYFKTSSNIPGLTRENVSERNALEISNVLNDLGQMKVVAAQQPDLSSLFETH